jgi:hypothetical protein
MESEVVEMKRRLLKSIGLAVSYGTLAGLLAGCAWSVGGKATSPQPTRGQELIDLKKAKDQGALTQEEYDNKRKQILEH